MTARMYHVVAINEKTGAKTYCTAEPVTHDEGCTMLGKFSPHPLRRVQLEEVARPTPTPGFWTIKKSHVGYVVTREWSSGFYQRMPCDRILHNVTDAMRALVDYREAKAKATEPYYVTAIRNEKPFGYERILIDPTDER